MTEPTWKYWTPERDGHAPDDWDGVEVELLCASGGWLDVSACPAWVAFKPYRYRPLQDATYEPDLLAQCLRLPQDQREALIEAMQKPQRDWADDIATRAVAVWTENGGTFEEEVAAVIRSMCGPKEVALDDKWLAKQAEFIWKEPYLKWPDLLRNLIREALA